MFLIPACLKETDIIYANETLKLCAQRHISNKKIYYAPFIEEFNVCSEFSQFIGFKEHFLIHNCFEWANRERYYKYLDASRKLLMLHCDNINRIDYVKFFSNRYLNMYIQVAQLGCFQNSVAASLLVLDELSQLSNVYFDSSAVYNGDVLAHALKIAPDKILFGTDVPYIGSNKFTEKYKSVIEICNISEDKPRRLFSENAFELINKII